MLAGMFCLFEGVNPAFVVLEGVGKVPVRCFAGNRVVAEQLPQLCETRPHLQPKAVVLPNSLDAIQHFFVQHTHVPPKVCDSRLED